MRYLGNKTKLLPFIEHVLDKYQIEGNTFADLFSGTGAVGDFFKGRFQILSNDFLYYSYVLNRAKLMNTTVPKFEKFKIKYKVNVYEWLNEQKFSPNEYYFIYNNYSPVGERMFFSKENAIQIDGIRIKIEELLLDGIVNDEEYYFLLASLVSVYFIFKAYKKKENQIYLIISLIILVISILSILISFWNVFI